MEHFSLKAVLKTVTTKQTSAGYLSHPTKVNWFMFLFDFHVTDKEPGAITTPTNPTNGKTENTDITLTLAISIPTVLVLLITFAMVIWLIKRKTSTQNTPTAEGVDQNPV